MKGPRWEGPAAGVGRAQTCGRAWDCETGSSLYLRPGIDPCLVVPVFVPLLAVRMSVCLSVPVSTLLCWE